jgi:hypothetical protein
MRPCFTIATVAARWSCCAELLALGAVTPPYRLFLCDGRVIVRTGARRGGDDERRDQYA